jgi:uncharacterized membrane protein
MLKLRHLWGNLHSSFWFVPLLLVLGSILLAIGLIEADSAGSDRWLAQWPRLFGAGAEGSRQMLATLAGSMMTVLGVTFSMTLVALTLASSQYTSRILRNFMRSRVTQGTLGTFAGIFTYCLIVLRTIRNGGGSDFVPGLAVFFGFVLALCSVGVLIFFIHHIASSIQASSIIASVARETMTVIEQLFPEQSGSTTKDAGDASQGRRVLNEATWRPIPAAETGYIQSVDREALLRLALASQTTLRMERGVGDFVVRNTALASLAQEDPLDQETITALNASYSISSHRTVAQDPAFGIRQIVDMALKALSPGVNDTSTAVMCIDYLTAILALLVTRDIPSSLHYQDGELRMIFIGPDFESLLDESLDQIRSSGAGNVAIMARILGALETISGQTSSARYQRALREQVQQIAELAARTVAAPHDRARIDERISRVNNTLETILTRAGTRSSSSDVEEEETL